jgi:hypothetical protein
VADVDQLFHYGILRKSGRYPWGSGADSQERSRGFLGYVNELKSKGMSEVEIARGFGTTTTELRAARAIAKTEIHAAQVALAVRLQNKGM